MYDSPGVKQRAPVDEDERGRLLSALREAERNVKMEREKRLEEECEKQLAEMDATGDAEEERKGSEGMRRGFVFQTDFNKLRQRGRHDPDDNIECRSKIDDGICNTASSGGEHLPWHHHRGYYCVHI